MLTLVLLDGMRQHNPELHALVEEWSERAALMEYDGGLTRAAAERLAWESVWTPYAGCPACGVQAIAGAIP